MNKDTLSSMIEVATPILDALHDGLVMIDARGIVRYVNEANTRITGLTRDEVLGRFVTDVVPYSRLYDVLSTGKPQTGVRTRVRDREVLSNIVPLHMGGELVGALSVFRDVTEVRRLTEQLQVATETIRTMQAQVLGQDGVVFGHHPLGKQAWRLAEKAALIPSTVLLTGESGTGKEVMARYIHTRSERRDKPFLAVNCAAIPDALLESELFGYEEGAFTGAKKGGRPGVFEMAQGGTLFLDEIAEMSVHLQAKLLRVLQDYTVKRLGGGEERKVDIRLIAATNRDLAAMVKAGGFRQDLYYRLAVFPIALPALREIRSDVPLFAQFFLEKAKRKLGRPDVSLSRRAMQALERYDFPGNFRELGNLLERAVALCDGVLIDAEDLPLGRGAETKPDRFSVDLTKRPLTLAELEQAYITRLMAEVPGKTALARRLGISRATLYRKLREYGLDDFVDSE